MMTPTFTKKNNRIYRYYTPTTVNRQSYADCKVGSVPAAELDTLVVAHIRQMIQSPEILTKIEGLMKEKKVSDFGFEEVLDGTQPRTLTLQNIVRSMGFLNPN